MRSITPTSASFSIQTSTRQGWVSHLSRRKLRAAAAMMAAGSSQCGLLSRLRVLSLDGVPVHQAGQARVADDVAEALVGALGVGDQVARDELVVKLAQGQLEPLRRVVADDGVRLPDDVEGSR